MSLKARVEAVLFLTDKPIRAAAIAKIVNVDVQLVRQALIELVQDYEARSSGLEIAADDGYIIQVKDEFASIIDEFLPVEMSHAHIRTLSAIAIKQPIPQSDIIKIRGAGAYDHIKELLEKELINKDENQGGRSPILTTTKKFQEYFRLTKDAKSLRQMLRKQDKPETQEGEPGEGEAEGFNEEDARQLLLMAQSIAGEAGVEAGTESTESGAPVASAENTEFAPDASSESMEAISETVEASAATTQEVETSPVSQDSDDESGDESDDDSDDKSKEDLADEVDAEDDSDEDDSDEDDSEDDDEDEESEDDLADEVDAEDEEDSDEDDSEDDEDSDDEDSDEDDDSDDEDDDADEDDEDESAEIESKSVASRPVEMDEPFSPQSAAPDGVTSGTTGDFIA